VASLNRPGGNITGVSYMNVELGAKRLGLLHELRPGSAPLAVLVEGANPLTPAIVTDLQAAARTIGRQIEVLAADSNGEIDGAFAKLAQKRLDGLLINPASGG
jgi:putative ABC transport system substrate-binding protein